jgi:hypothetical protein
VGGDRDGYRGVDPGELLDRQRVGEGVAAPAAVVGRERDPHQPQLTEPGDDLVGERLRAVELGGGRRHLRAREIAHHLAEQPLLV